VICSFLFSCSSNSDTDLVKNGLNGKVKSIKEIVYKCENKFGKFVEGEKVGVLREKKFNEEGNIEIDEISIPNTVFYRKDIYKYNSKGLRLNIAMFDYENNLISLYCYKYDSHFRVEFIDEFDSSSFWKSRYIAKYDSIERIINFEKYNSEGVFVFMYELKYDEENRITALRKKQKDIQNNVVISTFNQENNLIYNHVVINEFSQMNDFIIFENFIPIIPYENICNYNLCFTNYLSNYGLLNIKLETEYFYKDFEFDKKKNWIKKYVYNSNNYCFALIERQISYY
jgi:hypothetical protein